MEMCFDADEKRAVRSFGTTHYLSKRDFADFLTQKNDIDNKSRETEEDSNLERTLFLSYLPFIISIEMATENPNMIKLSPINVRMGISDELAEFLISK